MQPSAWLKINKEINEWSIFFLNSEENTQNWTNMSQKPITMKLVPQQCDKWHLGQSKGRLNESKMKMNCFCSFSTDSTNNEQLFILSSCIKEDICNYVECSTLKCYTSLWIYAHVKWKHIRNSKKKKEEEPKSLKLSVIKMYWIQIYYKHHGWMLDLEVKYYSNKMSSRFSAPQQESRPFWPKTSPLCEHVRPLDRPVWWRLNAWQWRYSKTAAWTQSLFSCFPDVDYVWSRVLACWEEQSASHNIKKKIFFSFRPACFHSTSGPHKCVFHVVSVWFCSKTSLK